MQLTAGANTPLPSPQIQITLRYQTPAGVELDVTAYVLADNGKVRGDADMVFYGQTATPNRSVEFSTQNQQASFTIDTQKLDNTVSKIAICATLNHQNRFNSVSSLVFEASSNATVFAHAQANCGSKQEAALIVAEVYRHKEQWKLRYVEQGFNGGLQPLAEHFGVDIAEPAPAVQATPAPTAAPIAAPSSAPKINLSKITLDKNNSRVSLAKKPSGFGRISVNLNWNQNPNGQPAPANGGFFKKLLGNGKNGIDLDVGAMVHFQNGDIDLVQALGNRFGQLNQAPFVQLQSDDRTGQSQDGEWLHINGQHWSELKRVVIYAFIYEGVPNWAATDGTVTIQVPDQAPIEIALTEGRQLPLCGIVELVNDNGNIQVNRIVEYFKGQPELDQRFGFGFQWKTGRK